MFYYIVYHLYSDWHVTFRKWYYYLKKKKTLNTYVIFIQIVNFSDITDQK